MTDPDRIITADARCQACDRVYVVRVMLRDAVAGAEIRRAHRRCRTACGEVAPATVVRAHYSVLDADECDWLRERGG